MNPLNADAPTKIAVLRASIPGLVLWLILLAVYGLYLPGEGATLYFDDAANLQGLSKIDDTQSALNFLANGIAGPLSRPIALASFLLNQGDWPHNPGGLIRVNLLIHLLNGAVLAWLSLRIFRLARPELMERSPWVGLSAAGLWLVLPILASTNLIVIQRMTSLSATFVLAGLLIYIIGLSWEAGGRTYWGRSLQVSGIGVGTLLAVFTKENGVLLPLYALTVEATVLASLTSLAVARRWRMILLALPIVALFGYLAIGLSAANYNSRNFTLTERLLTEPIILWDYIRLTFVPHANAFTPFHDDYPIATSPLKPLASLISILAWTIVLALAVWKRKRWPVFALAVLWYLAGHTLESSAIALELYFEHRNYLPVIGFALALAWIAWSTGENWQRTTLGLLAIYALILAWILWQTTSLWGNPPLAAEIWAVEHPNSVRATQYLAQRYQNIGNSLEAHGLLVAGAERDPREIDLALAAIQLSCERNDSVAIKRDLSRAQERVATGSYGAAAFETIGNLLDYRSIKRCDNLESKVIHKLLDGLLINPRYQGGRSLSTLYHLKARLYSEDKQFSETVEQLIKAYRADPNIGTAVILVSTLQSGGLGNEAIQFIIREREHPPLNPVLKPQWYDIMDKMKEDLELSITPSVR